MYVGLHILHLIVLSDFNEPFKLTWTYFRKFLNRNFHENQPKGAEFFYADGQRDRKKDRQTDT
jgi:hypothetical protein